MPGDAPAASENRLTITFAATSKEWLEKVAKHEDVSVSEAVRRIVERARSEEWERVADKPDRRSRRKKFFEAIGEVFEEPLAAERAGISRVELQEWMADPGFSEELEWHKDIFIAKQQLDLLKLGKGTMKGQALGILGFLNSHHYAYGRVKVEFLRRIVDPLIQELLDLVTEEMGDGQSDAVERIAKKFSVIKELALSVFSE